MTTLKKSDHAPVPFWRDERYLKIIIQVIVVALVVFSGFYLVRNLVTGL
ncbi:MAG TPA: amino acid ABC transporter permease, partial [Caldilineae bacterium]|nr:amino acid ABC transporter permease [Caldilineae bacterium]